MNELINLSLGLIWGAVLGVFYFGGLWLTIRHLPQSQQPSLLILVSFLGRSAVCLFGFYLAVGNGLEIFIFSLAGFVLTKIALVRLLGSNSSPNACPRLQGGELKNG